MTEKGPSVDETMLVAVREAWASLAPTEKWRGRDTGWTATDLWTLSGLIYETQPAAVVIAGDLGGGGLPLYVGDLLDLNKRGKALAAEEMTAERRRYLPEHRRVQYLPVDLTSEGGAVAVEAFIRGAAPALVIATTEDAPYSTLPNLVTIGGYFITGYNPAIQAGFMPDPGRDPFGLSKRAWLMRVPA